MTFQKYENFAFRMFFACNFYAWQFPFRWDYTNRQLNYTEPKIKWIPFLINMVYVWCFGWLGVLLSLYFNLVNTRPDFHMLNALIFILVWATFSVLCIYVLTWLVNLDGFTSTFNKIIKLSEQVEEEYSDRRFQNKLFLEQGFDATGLLPVIVIPTLALVPISVTIGGLVANLDASYFFVEEILPDPKYRSMECIMGAIAIRIMMIYLSSFETCRIISFGCCCLVILFDRVTKILTIILVRIHDIHGYLKFYVRLKLIIRKVEHLMNPLVMMGLMILFWGQVGCVWICVKCEVESITVLIYVSVMAIAILLISFHVALTPLVCKLADMAILCTKLNILRARFKYAKYKLKLYKYQLLQAKSIAPIRARYGSFSYFTRDFLVEYWCVFVDRTFDCIMIFDYTY